MLYVKINTEINPDGNSYSLVNIKKKNAIKGAIGYTPWIECNVDASRNSQLYQIYLCMDTSGFLPNRMSYVSQGKMWFRDWVPFLLKNGSDNHYDGLIFISILLSLIQSHHCFYDQYCTFKYYKNDFFAYISASSLSITGGPLAEIDAITSPLPFRIIAPNPVVLH